MAASTTLRLRGIWFQVHKLIGLLLAFLIVPISLSGAALVWHDGLDRMINPARYAVSAGGATQPPSAYVAAARAALGSAPRILTMRMAEHGRGPVLITAVDVAAAGTSDRGPPPRLNVWLDPATARVLDSAPANAGPVRFIHMLHGSLLTPGVGRQIVGWVGVFMFVSCLTGLWLWWPVTGSVKRGLRWKRQNSTNANLHHLLGFWVLLPLAMLSFSGVWISFPGLFSNFEAGQTKSALQDRARAQRALPVDDARLTPEAAVTAAEHDGVGRMVSLTWPTGVSRQWKVGFERPGGSAEVEVADATGVAAPPRAPLPETRARLMRRLHDGTGMGPAWQAAIFAAGLVPAALAVTGIVMWLRSRGWRARLRRKRMAALQPAE